jgi:hypothetical protein
MRKLALLFFCSSCLHHYQVRQPEDASWRVLARRLFGRSSIEVGVIDVRPNSISLAPSAARLVSAKCEARLGEWQYFQGGGVSSFAGVDVQTEHRQRMLQTEPVLKPESASGVINEERSPMWRDSAQDRRFTLRTGGYLLLRYDAEIRAECTPYTFALATEGGPSIAATLDE